MEGANIPNPILNQPETEYELSISPSDILIHLRSDKKEYLK